MKPLPLLKRPLRPLLTLVVSPLEHSRRVFNPHITTVLLNHLGRVIQQIVCVHNRYLDPVAIPICRRVVPDNPLVLEKVEQPAQLVVAGLAGEEGVEAGDCVQGGDGAAVVGGDGAAGVADEEGEVEGAEEGGGQDGGVFGGGEAVGCAVVYGGFGMGLEGGGGFGGFAVGAEEVVDYVFDEDAFVLGVTLVLGWVGLGWW